MEQVIAETAGELTVEEEARQGQIFSIHIYIEIGRKEECIGVKRDPANRGRDHTQGLFLSKKEKREKIEWIEVRSEWSLF